MGKAVDVWVPGEVPEKNTQPHATCVTGDLDCAQNIDQMVSIFYQRLLDDDVLGPVFLDVARIDLDKHLPLISLYWQKMLLGDTRYERHMMMHHRNVHQQQSLRGVHHERWLQHFHSVLDAHFTGPKTDQAKQIASNVINNMYMQFSRPV